MQKILSVKQPYATLLVAGIKKIEYRSWQTTYRGRLYIHASTGLEAKSDFIVPPEDMAYRMPVFSEWLKLAGKSEEWLGEYLDVTPDAVLLREKWKGDAGIIKEYQLLLFQLAATIADVNLTPEHAILGYVDLTDITTDGIEYSWLCANPVWYEKPILQVAGKLSVWTGDFPYTGGSMKYTFDM